MNRKTICLIIALFVVVSLTGCAEEQQAPQQWRMGELPNDWQEFFGADNSSRMNYVQARQLDILAARIKVLEDFCRIEDPNE